MKRMSRIICTLAALTMSLGAVTSANALLAARSQTLNPATGGHPTWFQDQNSVAVTPIIPATPFPAGFPAEIFFFDATSEQFPFGPAAAGQTAFVIMALEASWIDANGTLAPAAGPAAMVGPITPVVFQRMRIRISPPVATGLFIEGNYTLDHPWGTTTFTCSNPQNNKDCQDTHDVPLDQTNFNALLHPLPPPALPEQGLRTFLESTAPHQAGFLGDGLTPATVFLRPPMLRANVTLTGPPGVGSGTTDLFIITGKTLGLEVAPGVNNDFGPVNMNTPPTVPVTKTIKITNTTANDVTFAPVATTLVKTGLDAAGLDAADFIIAPPTQPVTGPALADCAAIATLVAANLTVTPAVPAGVCGFDIAFTPAVRPQALRAATLKLAPTAVDPANNPPPVTLNLSGTAVVTVAAATATQHGTITPDATAIPVVGTTGTFSAPAGSPVTFTVTPANKKFKVKNVADGVTLLTASPTNAAAFTLTNTLAVDHTVTATFMQSGDLNADGALTLDDALKALRIVAGVQQADVDDVDNTAVKVAPLTSGVPAALNAKTNPDIGDVLVILRRVLNLETW